VVASQKGEFVFGGLQPGSYAVVVEEDDQYQRVEQQVLIQAYQLSDRSTPSRSYLVTVRLRAKNSSGNASSSAPASVSAADEEAMKHLKRGDIQKAIEMLSDIVQRRPDLFDPRLHLGMALLEAREFETAAMHLKTAIELSDRVVVHLYLGIALIGQH